MHTGTGQLYAGMGDTWWEYFRTKTADYYDTVLTWIGAPVYVPIGPTGAVMIPGHPPLSEVPADAIRLEIPTEEWEPEIHEAPDYPVRTLLLIGGGVILLSLLAKKR